MALANTNLGLNRLKHLAFILVMFCCLPLAIAEPAEDQNIAFDKFKNEFLERWWELDPSYALYVGYYKYDDRLSIPDQAYREKTQAFAEAVSKQLKNFDRKSLSPSNVTDWQLIKNQIDSLAWYREEFKSFEWDPSNYNVAGVFSLVLNTNYKSLTARLLTIEKLLSQVPTYYQVAKSNVKKATIEHIDLAIQQNKGALGVFKQSIPEKLKTVKLDKASVDTIKKRLDSAVTAIEDYISWLKNLRLDLSQTGARDFRIGAKLYEEKFKYDIVSNFSAEGLYRRAVAEKEKIHKEMIELTNQLWPKYFGKTSKPEQPLKAVKMLIDKLAKKHVARDEFVNEVKRQVPLIEKFIIEKDLLDTDQSRPLVIRETPRFQRGIAGASVQSPGPYDATANTYYNVTPLDDYTAEQAESYLREYNHWILQILNIHEAMPGHYTQLVHANKSSSKIKSILGNGAMIEGWAVYSERMMLEAGYGNNEPELWLMYYKWNLRVVVNTILDYSVHVLGMTKNEALDLLMQQAFQEKAEAQGKWRRVTLTQVQLTSYYTGFAEIYALREEMKKKQGKAFDLKKFHNQFLSYGSAPVPFIRELMLHSLKK